jgi:dihydroneopterin aldolase
MIQYNQTYEKIEEFLKQEKLKLGEILGSEESDNLEKSLAQIKAK